MFALCIQLRETLVGDAENDITAITFHSREDAGEIPTLFSLVRYVILEVLIVFYLLSLLYYVVYSSENNLVYA